MKKNYFIAILFFSFLGVQAQKDFTQIGNASFYGDEFVGKYTASGEKYEHNLLTAAHLTLPFGTKVKVTNYENNKSVIVKVNDRGPFVQGRIIDLSKSAAENLGIVEKGLAKVRVEVVKGNSGSNSKPAATVQQPTQKTEKPVVNKPAASSGKEIFKVDISKTAEPGFGVQVASFNESFNFLEAISEIKKQVSEPVFINVTKQNDTVFYKVILGTVANRQQADALKKRLSNMFPGCFVVEF
jgi:rare lipoprotein A